MVGLWDQVFKLRDHLATITHAQAKGLGAMEEALKLVTQTRVKQNRLSPTATRAQHVAVAKATTGHQTFKVV